MSIELQPLIPHQYPLWIKIGFVICIAILLIFVTDIPYLQEMHALFKKADQAFVQHDYKHAQKCYENLLRIFPDNMHVKVRLAASLFTSTDKEDHFKALAYLHKVSLKQEKWQELCRYMPIEYKELFEDKKVIT